MTVALAVVGGAAVVGLAAAAGLHAASVLVTTLYSLAGVGVGLGESMFTRRTYTVWSPAGSVRGACESRASAPTPPQTSAPALTGQTPPSLHMERTGADV